MKKRISILTSIVLIFATICITSCKEQEAQQPVSKLFIITDTTASVDYSNSRPYIEHYLSEKFDQCFREGNDMNLYKIWDIGSNKFSFTNSLPFPEPYPQGNPSKRSTKDNISLWNGARNLWLNKQMDEMAAKIGKPGKGTITNIFNFIYALEKEKNQLKAEELIQVIAFTDMLHEVGDRSLKKLKNDEVSLPDIQLQFQSDVDSGKISLKNANRVSITLVTPKKNTYQQVIKYWETYFTQWGINFIHSEIE